MHCCTPMPSAPPPRAHAKPTRRLTAFIQWAIPLTTLALIPKCPACVAGYVLLFTGLGLSLPAAAAIRGTIITLCVAVLITLALRWALRLRTPT